MNRKELQTALKSFKSQGLTQIKLNTTTVNLQAEYDRLTIKPEVKSLNVSLQSSLIEGQGCDYHCKGYRNKASYRVKVNGTYSNVCEDCLKQSGQVELIEEQKTKAESIRKRLQSLQHRQDLQSPKITFRSWQDWVAYALTFSDYRLISDVSKILVQIP